MTLSYRGIRCRGKPDVAVSEVSQVVHRTPGLRRLIPRVCHEKTSARGNVEFYLFVGHVTTGDDADETTVGDFFEEIGQRHWFGEALNEEFHREQIKRMAGQDVRVEEFSRCLSYKPLVLPDAGDPFAEEDEQGFSLDPVDLTARFDKLLLWMSSQAEGSFATLDSARDALGIQMDTRRVLRALRLLGHCETSRNGARWSMAPSVVVKTEQDRFVLCGRRDGALLQALRERLVTEQVPQPNGAGPSAFLVRVADLGDVTGLGIETAPLADRALAEALPRAPSTRSGRSTAGVASIGSKATGRTPETSIAITRPPFSGDAESGVAFGFLPDWTSSSRRGVASMRRASSCPFRLSGAGRRSMSERSSYRLAFSRRAIARAIGSSTRRSSQNFSSCSRNGSNWRLKTRDARLGRQL